MLPKQRELTVSEILPSWESDIKAAISAAWKLVAVLYDQSKKEKEDPHIACASI